MINRNPFSMLDDLKGKTIAVVYIYEGDTANGYSHYEAWRSDVISSWLSAIDALECFPLILDLRTFVYKAMNNSLPPIDYVVNLNNGSNNLSILGIIPSICAFLEIPCIPCDTYSIIVGENKAASNLIAYAKKMNVPKELDMSNPEGIFRPLNLGSSKGIQLGIPEKLPEEFLYQEFIEGYDITIPLLYSPSSDNLVVLPGILYYPETKTEKWFLDDERKRTHGGYRKTPVTLDKTMDKQLIALAKSFSIKTFCRIDCRIRCSNQEDINELLHNPIDTSRLYFLEINPTPTIKDNINFFTSLNAVDDTYAISKDITTFKNYIKEYSNNAFILACSIVALSKAKH